MGRYSGIVLDQYDELEGNPVNQRVELIKQAAIRLDYEQRNALPDKAFALVAVDDDGGTIRKYACVDEGTTGLSVYYFLNNHHKLEPGHMKTAAANLTKACRTFDLYVPPQLEKIALIGRAIGAGLTTLVEGPKMVNTITKNKTKATGGLVNPNILKTAEVNGSPVMSMQPKQPVNKKLLPDYSEQKKIAQNRYALPHKQKYPINTPEQIKQASAYFEQYHKLFDAKDRHVFAQNICKLASALDIDLGPAAIEHGGDTLRESAAATVEYRFKMAKEAGLEKTASQYERLLKCIDIGNPEVIATTCEAIDKLSGLNFSKVGHAYDQLLDKYASEEEKQKDIMLDSGTHSISLDRFKDFINNSFKYLEELFGEDAVEELKKDPEGIFNSMPKPQKQLLVFKAIQYDANQ